MENNTSKFKEFLLSGLGRTTMIAVFYLIIWGLVAFFAGIGSSVIAFILFALMSYFGWKALIKITPDFFLIMPIGGWIIYFIIKGLLAFFVGFFIAPFQIAKMITAKIQGSIE